jgi:hypothetical protein
VIQPLDATAQQEVAVRGVSIDYRLYCDPADIVPEDIVTIDGEDFTVVEIAKWPRTGTRLMELSLREYQQV